MRSPTPLLRQPDDAGALPTECLDTEQVAPAYRERALLEGNQPLALAVYGLLGAVVGLVFTQSQVISWFRIYEMFRFESFHMYGIIGSAVVTAALSLVVIKRLGLTTVHGEPIELSPKAWGGSRVPGARYWMGGTVFGLGWALLGACPGPLVALIGGGISVMLAALVAALAGTWAYAALRDHLPH
ncbi:YeeE/YedE family protein [Rubrivirga sp. IMCC45206]|uniref:YeeE/YedE family protein n=1 Tax=Rubrivirga sp. IMCC45206 TaxID=3391614 RepID=UPI00398FF9AA